MLKEIGDEKTYMLTVNTDSTSSVFYTKSLGTSSKASAAGKTKTVKKECTIRLAAASEEFINA